MPDHIFTDAQVQLIASAIVFAVRPFLIIWLFSVLGSLTIRFDEYRDYKRYLREEAWRPLTANKNG